MLETGGGALDSGNALRLIQSRSRYVFDVAEFARLTGRNDHAARVSLARLARRGHIQVMHKRPSVWLIVPPEYTQQGAPPFTWWAHDCLSRVVPFYYVGLLSAARLWGATSLDSCRLQSEQVVVSEQRAPLGAGSQTIHFITKAEAARTPVAEIVVDARRLRVSTREATLLDLLRHLDKAGGLEVVARLIRDWSAQMKAAAMVRALDALGQVAVAQRLGFLLERIGLVQMADLVASWLSPRRIVRRSLSGSEVSASEQMDERWAIGYSPEQQALLGKLRLKPEP